MRTILAAGVIGVLPSLFLFAPTPMASAECTNAGGVTVCAQGDVRGGGGSGSTGPYFPYPCDYDYYCDSYGVDVILDVDLPDGDIGRPGPPGMRPDNSLPGGGRGGGGRGGGGRR